MATNMPLPLPPRTPTPPPDDDDLRHDSQPSPEYPAFNPNSLHPNGLSPLSATFASPTDSLSQRATPSSLYSPDRASFLSTTPATAVTTISENETSPLNAPESAANAPNPFNFQPVSYMPAKTPTKQVAVCQHPFYVYGTIAKLRRISAGDVDTSTSTVASHIRSF